MKIKFKKYWRKTGIKNTEDAEFLLKHIEKIKPKNFLEIGVFHGVTSRNVCEMLYSFHGNDFKFTGIDLFLNESTSKNEHIPTTTFSNPLKTIYYNYIIREFIYLRQLKNFKNQVK